MKADWTFHDLTCLEPDQLNNALYFRNHMTHDYEP